MNMITLPNTEYRQILRNQSNLVQELRQLKSVVRVAMADEATDRIRARLERRSKIMDRGGSKVFRSMREFDRYLKNL
ncbi:MAG: hypothetical protein HYT48_02785 [Candidatus Vogelbacteria bacterium]|nr:hypothetical protein [Candidatus Vogelbacteria bacterium]